MRKGDKIICYKSPEMIPNRGVKFNFTEGNGYIIDLISIGAIYLKDDKGLTIGFSPGNIHDDAIDNFFYSVAELRDKQINSILYD